MKVTLKQQLAAFNDGIIIDNEGDENKCYNFYDWFCKEKSLKGKSEKLFKAVKRFVEKYNVDISSVYVFFKNNCPMNRSLYDDFRICDIETGDVIWTVIPKCGHSGKAEIWGRANNFKEAIITGNNLSEIYRNK